MTINHEVEMQRSYYAETAAQYDGMHLNEKDEHYFALTFMVAALEHFQIRSILDIGSGTGRVLRHLKMHCPDIRIVGVEPVSELRDIGYGNGLTKLDLIEGDATMLDFGTDEFDLVCEFGVLHHIRNPERAISEMLRVANKAIFISDANNFGQGSPFTRLVKQWLNLVGLWKFADLVKTNGKGYSITAGDGLAYSYSVFTNYKQISRQCRRVHLLNTKDGSINPYKTASHVALLGIKD